jgi:hypothetical protein
VPKRTEDRLDLCGVRLGTHAFRSATQRRCTGLASALAYRRIRASFKLEVGRRSRHVRAGYTDQNGLTAEPMQSKSLSNSQTDVRKRNRIAVAKDLSRFGKAGKTIGTKRFDQQMPNRCMLICSKLAKPAHAPQWIKWKCNKTKMLACSYFRIR